MKSEEKAIQQIKETLDELGIEETISRTTKLIGSGGVVDSMGLVQICLALEDCANELNFEFDWTSENAMSRSRGIFHSVDSLVFEFVRQEEKSGEVSE